MKVVFLIFLTYSLNIFSADLVNWKSYKKNTKKPVFILLTDGSLDKSNDKIFSNKRLSKLLNDKFYSIKVNINKELDLKNRYLFMTPPSIAILNPKGIIITKKRNYSAITIETDLLKYLESLKNKSIKKALSDVSRQAMYRIFYPTYFMENTKELIDRKAEIQRFMKRNLNMDTMFFKVRFLKPLYNYVYSILNGNFSEYEKLVVQAHVDTFLSGKIFNEEYIYKASFKNWSNPQKIIIYKDNISLVKILLNLDYKKKAKKVLNYLNSNYDKLSIEEKILFKTVSLNFSQDKSVIASLETLIKENKNSKYLNIQIAIFKAYLKLYEYTKSDTIKNDLFIFVNNFDKNFYDEEKGAFYDVKIGEEPFGFKFIPIIENIEIAYLYTLLYEIRKDFNDLIMARYILSLMNKTSVDNLIYSKYLLVISNLNEAR